MGGTGPEARLEARVIIGTPTPSLRAKRSNPENKGKDWIASSLSLLAMTIHRLCYSQFYLRAQLKKESIYESRIEGQNRARDRIEPRHRARHRARARRRRLRCHAGRPRSRRARRHCSCDRQTRLPCRDRSHRFAGEGRCGKIDRAGQTRVRRARYSRQQRRRHQARRFFEPDRRRLGRRLRAEILRPCAARTRRLAVIGRARWRAHLDRRHRRAQADRGIHDRQLGQCRGCRLQQMSRRPRQD